MGNNSLIGGLPSSPVSFFHAASKFSVGSVVSTSLATLGKVIDHFAKETLPDGKLHLILAASTAHPSLVPIFLGKGLASLATPMSGLAAGTVVMNPMTSMNPKARANNLKQAVERGDKGALTILMKHIGDGNVFAVTVVCGLISENVPLAGEALEELASVDLDALWAMATRWDLPLKVNQEAARALRRLSDTAEIDHINARLLNYYGYLVLQVLEGPAEFAERTWKLFSKNSFMMPVMAETAGSGGKNSFKAWECLIKALQEASRSKNDPINAMVIDAIRESVTSRTLSNLMKLVEGIEDPDSAIADKVAKILEILISKTDHEAALAALKNWRGHPRAERLQHNLGISPPTRIIQGIARITATGEFPPSARTKTPKSGFGPPPLKPPSPVSGKKRT